MTNFNYQPMYATRKATESHREAIEAQIGIIANLAGDQMSYVDAMNIMNHLRKLERRLGHDLKYFDAIDRAMEEAVR